MGWLVARLPDSGSKTLHIHQLLDHAEAKAVIFLMRLAAVAFGFHHELFVGSHSLPLIFQTFPESLISDVYLMGVCMQFWGLNDILGLLKSGLIVMLFRGW